MVADNDLGQGETNRARTRRGVLKAVSVGIAGLGISSGPVSGEPATSRAELTGTGAMVGKTGAANSDACTSALSSHTISDCTTITSPGTYEVVADITATGDQPCIEIRADDVTLRGNGHEISGTGDGIGIAANLDSTDGGLTIRESIRIEDLTVTDFGTGIHYADVSGGRIEGVTARNNGLGVGFRYGVAGVTVRNSTLADSHTGFRTIGDTNVWGGPGSNVLEHNAIEANDVGIDLGFSTNNHDFLRNRIVGNGGGARHRTLDSSGHTYCGNVICANPDYGIRNEDLPAQGGIPAWEDVVEATDNYWGAANGPSSIGAPSSAFEDPTTGALADGDGVGISESLDPGVANVRFDPFLTSAPADAGLQ